MDGEFLEMKLRGTDREIGTDVVDIGIDSHLEGFTRSSFSDDGRTLFARVHVEEIPIFIRRLREYGDFFEDEDLADEAEALADDIEGVLEGDEEDNPGALGPSFTYANRPRQRNFPEGGIPPGAVEEADLHDGSIFDLHECDHHEEDAADQREILGKVEAFKATGEVPEDSDEHIDDQVDVELIVQDQGPLIVPWARFADTFNINEDAPVALSHRQEDRAASGSVVRGIDFSERMPMMLAANPGAKKIPLPLTTPSRLRIEKLDGSMQGWAYPTEERGQYTALWSDGSSEEVDRKDVHYIKSTIRAADVLHEMKRTGQIFEPRELGIDAGNLLRENDKLVKGRDEGYYSLGLMLSPWQVAGVGNLCPFASKGCSIACLNESGQGEIREKGVKFGKEYEDISWPQEFRKRSTLLFMRNRPAFMELLNESILRAIDDVTNNQWIETKGERRPNPVYGMTLCLRLNTLSDVPWEALKYKKATFMERFPAIQFYDYTKNPERMEKFLNGQMPPNYYLTFSWSEANAPFAFWVLEHGGGVAVPFDTAAIRTVRKEKRISKLPSWWNGFKVIDADITDIRFLDRAMFTDPRNIGERWSDMDLIELQGELARGRGFVCGLRLKGKGARKEHNLLKEEERREGLLPTEHSGGFVQYADDAGMRPKNGRPDQVYVPAENKTDAALYPDIDDNGTYREILEMLADRHREAQSKEGFNIIKPEQLKRLGLMEGE